jgi:hypothetical protein
MRQDDASNCQTFSQSPFLHVVRNVYGAEFETEMTARARELFRKSSIVNTHNLFRLPNNFFSKSLSFGDHEP